MSEYIEKEALLQDLAETVIISGRGNSTSLSAEMRGVRKVIDRIKAIPTSDVNPVKHGHWDVFVHSAFHGIDDYYEPIYRDVIVYYCSKCRRKTVIKENYCPNCGAKMDEVSK